MLLRLTCLSLNKSTECAALRNVCRVRSSVATMPMLAVSDGCSILSVEQASI